MPALVDPALFLEVKRRLETKPNPQGRHRENGEYLLTGKLFCGACNQRMVGISGRGRHGEQHFYYRCQGRVAGTCEKRTVLRDWIEGLVTQATVDYVLRPDVIQLVADAVMAYQEREAASARLLSLRADLDANAAARANVMKAIEAGIITITTKERLVELETEAARLSESLALEEASLTKFTREDIVRWIESFRGGDVSSQTFRRKVIDSFVSSVHLKDDHVRVVFNYSGKRNEVDFDIVMNAEALGEPLGLYSGADAPPQGSQTNLAAIYFVGAVFVLVLPLPLDQR